MEWTKEKIAKLYEEINAKAKADPEFAEKLLADPKAVIEEATGCALPAGYEIRVVEENGNYRAVSPKGTGELSEKELEEVAGGAIPPDYSYNDGGSSSK